MKDTPERDLAVADDFCEMADARIRELEAERDALRSENKTLKTFLRQTAIDAHAAFHIGGIARGPTFKGCREGSCERARATLGETK